MTATYIAPRLTDHGTVSLTQGVGFATAEAGSTTRLRTASTAGAQRQETATETGSEGA